MKKYQIVELAGNHNHAGTKATADIANVATGLGYEVCNVTMCTTKPGKVNKLKRQIGFLKDWNKAYKTIEAGSFVLLQHPFHYPQITREKILRKLKDKKHVKFISVVHDVEELRAFRYNDYYKHEFEVMLELADIIIVHNEKMLKYFVDNGVPESKLVNLKIFDYLQDNKNSVPRFEKAITIAGNLDITKCGYIGELRKLTTVGVKLYGPNFDETMKELPNVNYMGSFPANEIPSKLVSGFGLVWDGTSIDGCVGQSGQYLRYNNPHKLSLYLSSCMPVVIWKEAAEASFVKEHNVGLCVDSVLELEDIFKKLTKEEYDEMAANAASLSDALIKGEYASQAITRAEKSVEKQK